MHTSSGPLQDYRLSPVAHGDISGLLHIDIQLLLREAPDARPPEEGAEVVAADAGDVDASKPDRVRQLLRVLADADEANVRVTEEPANGGRHDPAAGELVEEAAGPDAELEHRRLVNRRPRVTGGLPLAVDADDDRPAARGRQGRRGPSSQRPWNRLSPWSQTWCIPCGR